MQRHKILAFLLALVASIGLWVYAVTFVNPDDTTSISDIRVRLTGTSALTAKGLMLTGGEEQYIDVEIAGRRSDLKELNSSTLEAVADVSNIDGAGTFEVSWTLNPPATVASGDISLVSASSNVIKVKISTRRDREIPIELQYTDGALQEGYLRGETYSDVETILVSGPAEEVNPISKAVVTVDLTGANAMINQQMEYTLVDESDNEVTLSDYTTISAETVGVTVQVLPYKDIELTVSFKAGAGLTKDDVSYVVSPSSIRVTGLKDALDEMDDSYAIEIDLATIQGIDPVTLTRSFELPEGVVRWGETSASSVTAEIDLQISEEIGILRIPLGKTELRWTNGLENMEYSYADSDQVIEIRGLASELKELEAKLNRNEIIIVVNIDINQMDQTQMCPLTIVLPAGYGAGLFEQYSARIEAKEAVPNTP